MTSTGDTAPVPEENAKDLADIPASVKNGLEIVPVARMDEVLKHALLKLPTPIVWEEEIKADAKAAPVETGEQPGFVAHLARCLLPARGEKIFLGNEGLGEFSWPLLPGIALKPLIGPSATFSPLKRGEGTLTTAIAGVHGFSRISGRCFADLLDFRGREGHQGASRGGIPFRPAVPKRLPGASPHARRVPRPSGLFANRILE